MNRKYKIKDDYFNIIDSEEKAYFFGLLLADGYNNREGGLIAIDLQEDDLEILKLLNSAINIDDRPIPEYENKHAVKRRFRVTLSSRILSDKLNELGMVANKSHRLLIPKGVPEDLMNHFIRGYFDGNGSIGQFGKIQNCEFSIVSTKTFLLWLQKILMINCTLTETKLGKRHKDRVDEIYHIKYTGRNSCLRLRDYLYDNASIYMARKRDKFFKIALTKS